MRDHNSVILSVNELQLEFNSKIIFNDIDLTVYEGDFFTILGHNGCGKSSFLKCIAGIYKPTNGSIQYNISRSKEIVYLNQNIQNLLYPTLTVLENCLMWNIRKKGRVYQFFSRKERHFFSKYLSEFHANLPKKLNQPVGYLSGGEQQIFLLALIMLHPPKLLLLDEHTSALDPNMSQQLLVKTLDLIREKSITVFMITHDLSQIEQLPGSLLILKDKKIYARYDDKKPSFIELMTYY